jgi:hypothetical protein
VLMGAPREWTHRALNFDYSHTTVVRQDPVEGQPGWLDTTCRNAGHEGARTALAQLAEGWREHLPVLADWFEYAGWLCVRSRAHRDAWCAKTGRAPSEWLAEEWSLRVPGKAIDLAECPAPSPLAECPALPTWVLAWLAGECLECGGDGGVTCPCSVCDAHGLAIGPRLPALEADILELWRRATVECSWCYGAGRVGHRPRFPNRPLDTSGTCERCAGLGRVKGATQEAHGTA